MDYLQRLRYVTERYEQLQGLRLVPLGIPFLFSSAWRGGHLAWASGATGLGARLWFLALTAAAIGLSAIAKAYYQRRFGDVQAAATAKAPLAAFAFTALFVLAGSLEAGHQPHVSTPALILALGIGYVGLVGGRVRVHYLAVAAAVALFSTFGLLGVPFHTRDVLWDRLVGLAFVVIGLGDHLLLRRTLVPVPHADAL